MAITLHVPQRDRLPDNAGWTNRFEIRSESSNRVYIIAQSIDKRYWGCSCPGWKSHRKCKHLTSLNLPCFEKPHEVLLASPAAAAKKLPSVPQGVPVAPPPAASRPAKRLANLLYEDEDGDED